ncbi:tRNA (adenosine(37)-N6)-threonylcarbamoyltransferase complex dimerization subunit type 1 TsaB [Patulibacter defluvii]|uniref:tRNA (adenosine(37)-N6)-threonylcarbamoyltransferase complex dimerization subunit type 1 TsaB n=1 Tax=Patulibacter defluvii TaxID=3095358 RepID=UPI002A747E32|nr:tRNA (adenosine(37)-N6)-threonylcarbamoyltransferase complex dimerization subunit type 1 TsaB [Patulibacter sp. DM4]
MAVSAGWTLALDTATPATVAAAIAPGPDGATAARHEPPPAGQRPAHTARLLALADEVLAETGGGLDRLGRIVVGLGPGTFTGIRVGVATARSLALATGTPLVGLPTPVALVAAAADLAGEGPVLAVQDARRRELFLTLGDGAPFVVPVADLAAALAALPERPAVAVGDGAPVHRAALEAAGIAVPDDPRRHAVDGLALARAGAAIAVTAPADVRPVYVRGADAIPTSRR